MPSRFRDPANRSPTAPRRKLMIPRESPLRKLSNSGRKPMFLPRMGFGLPTLVLITVCVILSGTAQADPIRITTVKAFSGSSPGEISTVDLAESPGAILGGQQVDFGTTVRAVVTFEAILNGRQSGILRAGVGGRQSRGPSIGSTGTAGRAAAGRVGARGKELTEPRHLRRHDERPAILSRSN